MTDQCSTCALVRQEVNGQYFCHADIPSPVPGLRWAPVTFDEWCSHFVPGSISTDQCSNCFYVRQDANGEYFCHADIPNPETAMRWAPVAADEWCSHFSLLALIGLEQALLASIPLGGMIPYTGTDGIAPTNFVFPYGQAISRATYATYYAKIGDYYGAGNGTTTFNVIDMRGRTTAGLDNMGGSSANRLTTPINGDTIGAAGGNEAVSSSAQTLSGATKTPLAASGSDYFEVSSGTATPGAATSVIQPTIVVPWLLRVL